MQHLNKLTQTAMRGKQDEFPFQGNTHKVRQAALWELGTFLLICRRRKEPSELDSWSVSL